MSEDDFPEARIQTVKRPWYKTVSRMWIATVACAILAIGLTWYNLDTPGTGIVIHFPDGHGIKSGDAIRHRGIDIGEVLKVELDESMDNVAVHAELVPSASAIACDGSRFWIVRPQLELTGISGLETAVGAKYIAVQPGDSKLKRFHFDGLASRPPEGARTAGIELVLRGDERFGVHTGSPLTWRGVEVGTVLAIALSPDARHVDVHVHVDESYRRLVSRSSKFWVTSGIDLELGVTGLQVSSDSLASIARGGIAFITPGESYEGMEVRAGDVFTLHKEEDPEWTQSADSINLLRRDLPAVCQVRATWKAKRLGFTRNFEATASALVIQDSESAVVVFPRDLVAESSGAIDGTFQLTLQAQSAEIALDLSVVNDSRNQGEDVDSVTGAPLVYAAIDVNLVDPPDRIEIERIGVLGSAEDCFAMRRSWSSENETAAVIEMIGQDELYEEDAVWTVANSNFRRDVWHGAAVIAGQDESVVGMLLVADQGPVIVPLAPVHFP